MAKSTAEKTNIRLKAVLDVLAEGVWSGESLNAGEVLAGAIQRVPFDAQEGELLSGGIPRGHKGLTTATSKLVKAGWLVKGRSGWTITDDGLRATVAFEDPDDFATALKEGTPVPADMPVPEAPAKKPAAKRAAAAKASAPKTTAKPATKTSKASKVADKAAEIIEDAVEPIVKAVRGKKAPAKTAAKSAGAEGATAETAETPETSANHLDQPGAVAIAGDFNKILGAPEDWAPQYDEAQMEFDFLDQLWKKSAELPAGHYTFKIALNRSWDENYGAFGTFDGPNHELHHAGGTVTIRYNHSTRDITIN